ncbi:hypothetical protein [Hufsiella ginkgonis]|uniref:Gliding motility protein GldL n=1 Tax=Hufsiella ginkgonis TaxID=2695274 RepID=A0A7K1Y3I0_9SPHI|nr:hypothetical protein [Hufsiella ginkgonis]MXV17599.1 hypothetical protein [Hufsiella ginkgonis]
MAEYDNTESLKNANTTKHYVLITIAVIVGMVGVLLRFVNDSTVINYASNIILVIGVVLALKAVKDILG